MRSKKFALIVALIIFSATSPKATVRAQPIFHVPMGSIPVTLDGVITGDEWTDATRMDVTFERDGITYDGTIYLKHNCAALWMCVQVEDDDEDPGDCVTVDLDSDGNSKVEVGDDSVRLVHEDQPMDLAYTDEPHVYQEDDVIGGVNNVDGASEWDGGVYTFELSKPFCSGDYVGYDIAVSPGDEIRADFIYIDASEPPGPPPEAIFMLLLYACPYHDVVVPSLQNSVTLDGAMTGDEWADAVSLPVYFNFYNVTDYSYLGNRQAAIYFKHNYSDLWICVEIEDPIENVTVWDDYPSGLPNVMGDSLFFFYDVSGDTTISAGDDEKGMMHPNYFWDGALISTPPGWAMDTDLGGSIDMQGSSCWSDGWMTYEMVHPLNSSDSSGYDPALQPGDAIPVFFSAMDPEMGVENYGWVGTFNLIMTRAASSISNFDILFASNMVRMIYPSDTTPKPLGCGAAWVSDWLASALIYTKLVNVTEGLDTDPGFVNQDTGKAIGDPGVGIISFGGQFVNPVVKYAECDWVMAADKAPIKFYLDGTTFRFQYRNGTNIPGAWLPQSVINVDEDMFVIEVFRDKDGRYMMLCYGFGWKGTYAAGKYFDREIYPNLESYAYGWVIVKWEDTNGDGFVNAPGDGDTYTSIAVGS